MTDTPNEETEGIKAFENDEEKQRFIEESRRITEYKPYEETITPENLMSEQHKASIRKEVDSYVLDCVDKIDGQQHQRTDNDSRS